jgi:hypothetical protein
MFGPFENTGERSTGGPDPTHADILAREGELAKNKDSEQKEIAFRGAAPDENA